MERKRVLLVLILLFAVIYYAARVAISLTGLSGEMSFDEEQSALIESVVLFSFLAVGVAGLLLLPGVYLLRPWGFWGTIVVSSYTIVFDLWAFLFVQSSAIAGVAPAAIIAGYLLLTRRDYLIAG